jgi:hypothetical protein
MTVEGRHFGHYERKAGLGLLRAEVGLSGGTRRCPNGRFASFIFHLRGTRRLPLPDCRCGARSRRTREANVFRFQGADRSSRCSQSPTIFDAKRNGAEGVKLRPTGGR